MDVISTSPVSIRNAHRSDEQHVWRIIEPVIRAGETYALPSDWSEREALEYWFSPSHRVRVAVRGGQVIGTYYLMANQLGGGDHVANCGYVTDPERAMQGIATAMCLDSLGLAKRLGFQAIQFNFVVESNRRAIALWQRLGFIKTGTIPNAFRHPSLGLTAAFVMWRSLDDINVERD